MKKERLDVLLVELGEFESREKAKRNIMAGLIFVDGQRVDKAGTKVKRDSKIEVKGKALPYVSRGGLKLEKAIKEHGVHVETRCAWISALQQVASLTACFKMVLVKSIRLMWDMDNLTGNLEMMNVW